ncbi:hypothetical protein DW121_07735 [Bacteroides sp. AM10-21B]|nr:hypothetical protein [Bacteroides propionicigenes]RGM28746.1 hypothetical protein DXC20_07865 [Bacteroides sp. OM08-17BH]RHJ51574.1 hypothetical protein DW121_07735 [Bacteroides sp. AM10-21B]HBO06903.1 hypothetical protein [Bacteroides sp.]
MAQQISIVSGKVLNLPEGEKKARPFPVTEKVYVFAFNTVAAARDALKQLEGGGGTMMSDADAVAGPDGYYEIRVAENGALIFRVAMKSELLEVNYKQTIDLSIDGGIALDEVEVVAESKRPQPKPVAGKIVGNKLIVDNSVTIPNNYGAANRRLIMQPYVLDCTTEDTVRYIDPTVIDGVEYGLTQDRRMAYNMKNDILAPFINQRRALNEERFDLIVKDSVPVPDPRRIYSVLTKVIIADYTHPTYQDEWKLTTCKIKRPLQFLEFSFPDFALDPNKYKETPRRERRNTAGNISLTFLVGKAQLDPEDPNNELQMNKLKNNLLEIINGEGTTLKEFKITGVSSPEGRYASNLALAKERTNFALQQITSVIPAEKWKRVYKHPTETRVATWDEVADLLEQDSLLNEAEEIRAVTKKFKNPDAQFATISRLPYYATTIKERLPRLRTVQYEYKHEIFRELNPDEILDRYQNDPNYREGKKQFTRYEYWHLFQMVKDPKEAEKIFRRAYKETMAYDLKGKEKPWILAANNLAIALLRRDTFDIEVLKPLVDITRKVNLVDRFNDGISVIETEVNPEVVVANQLAMYIRAYNFDDASILAGLLPDTERFQMIKAFANCLGGYYDYRGAANVKESEERKKVFQLVKSSSPMNNIVMCMAMETDLYNREAEKILKEMPVNALTKYLKLVLFIRANKLYEWSYDNALAFDEACKMLDEIIKMETKYHKIAENDGEISKEFMEYFDQGDWKLY